MIPDTPRFVYHGTDATTALRSLKEGLLPRSMTRKQASWSDFPSRDDLVYLTSCYACYFGIDRASPERPFGVIEIDTERLDKNYFLPDEDFIEQATRQGSRLSEVSIPGMSNAERRIPIPGTSMEERTQFVRDHLQDFQRFWQSSLIGLGTIAHRGPVPREAIRRVATLNPNSNPLILYLAYPAVVGLDMVEHYGPRGNVATRWLMGEEISEEELYRACYRGIPRNSLTPDMQKEWKMNVKWLSKRHGHKLYTSNGRVKTG